MKQLFLKLLIISGVVFGVVFVCSFFPFSRSIVYSMEKKMIFKRILSLAEDYSLSETFFCKIYYTDKDAEYVNQIGSAVDFYYPLILDNFNISINAENIEKVTFIIFPDEESLCGALGLSYESVPMGVYYGGIINVLSPQNWIRETSEARAKERFIREGPLVHELIHFATDLKTNGNYPVWFTEGVALYYENKITAFEWRPDLCEASKAISAEDLRDNFRDLDEGLSYRRAFDVIREFTDLRGESALQDMLVKLGGGAGFERLWQAASP